MKYNFDSIIDRKNTNSLKWDLFDDEYPMWVADMDFLAAPLIQDSLENNVKQGIYGYSLATDEYFEAYIRWWKRYGLSMERGQLLFATSIVPAITSIIRAFTDENDNILIQPPVYDLEEKMADSKTKLMILCNPHNPIGKIWRAEDLEKIAILAKKHNVIVVSDEIHCDLTDPAESYTPFASLDEDLTENSFSCISPTKTFNIAGIPSSAVFTRNKDFHKKLERQLNIDVFSLPTIFSVNATIAAYQSEEWLNELKKVLFNNKSIVQEFLCNEIPDIKMVPCNATYLLWLDCSKLNTNDDFEFSKALSEFLREKVGLFLSPGVQFGQNGDNFLRMNIACPKELLLEGLNALKIGIEKFKLENNIE